MSDSKTVDDLNDQRNLGFMFQKSNDHNKAAQCFIDNIENNPNQDKIYFDFLCLATVLNKTNTQLSAKMIEWVFIKRPELKFAYENPQKSILSDVSLFSNTIARDFKYNEQLAELKRLSKSSEYGDTVRLFGFLDAFHGFKQPEYGDAMQRPSYHVFPHLKAQAFHPLSGFSWAENVEHKFEDIKHELLQLFSQNSSIKPYIKEANTGNTGLDTLANSLNWSSIHLIQGGEYRDELLKQCPVLSSVLKELPLPVLSGNAPEAFLSVLKPNTAILPHYGLSNIKLTVHLGIDIPSDCAIRVGNDTHTWQQGKLMVFDDSFEHEAWNKSNENRIVFIFEIWHPELNSIEIEGIQAIMKLQNEFNQSAQLCDVDSLLQETKNVCKNNGK